MGEFSPVEDAPVHSQHRLSEAPESQILIPIITVTIINYLMKSMRILYTLSQRYSVKSIESVKKSNRCFCAINNLCAYRQYSSRNLKNPRVVDRNFLFYGKSIKYTYACGKPKKLGLRKSLRDVGESLCRSYSRQGKVYHF